MFSKFLCNCAALLCAENQLKENHLSITNLKNVHNEDVEGFHSNALMHQVELRSNYLKIGELDRQNVEMINDDNVNEENLEQLVDDAREIADQCIKLITGQNMLFHRIDESPSIFSGAIYAVYHNGSEENYRIYHNDIDGKAADFIIDMAFGTEAIEVTLPVVDSDGLKEFYTEPDFVISFSAA